MFYLGGQYFQKYSPEEKNEISSLVISLLTLFNNNKMLIETPTHLLWQVFL